MKRLVFRAPILVVALSFCSVASAVPGQTLSWSNLDADQAGNGGTAYIEGDQYFVMQSFTTGSSATLLQSIVLDMDAGSGSGFSLALYSAGVNAPGSLLETLSGSTAPTVDTTYSFTSGSSIVLSANTTYWWVTSVEPLGGSFSTALTPFSSATSDSGWSIGEGYWTIQSGDSFDSLSSFGGRSFKFAVATSAIPEPSTYAAFAGLGALGFVISRRRRVGARVATA